MERTRVKDWLIGAIGMLLVLGLAVGIFWLVVSDPAGRGESGPVPSSPTIDAERPPDVEPPVTLGKDGVWLADLELDAGTVMTESSTLRDVRAVGQGVSTGPDGLVASQLVVDATVPFAVVADELGNETVVSDADDGQAMVVRTVEILARELRVSATGTVEVEAGKLVVEPRSIDFGGPDFLSGVTADVVRQLVTIEHDIEGLPEGLVLQNVTVQSDGFRANFVGENVKIVP